MNVIDSHAPYRSMFNSTKFLALRDRVPEYQDLAYDGVKLGDLAVVEGINGWKAPYGGIDWRRNFWRPEMIHGAICNHHWGELTEIRCKPSPAGPNEAAALNALFCAGWTTAEVALNFYIPLVSLEHWTNNLPRQTIHSMNRATEAQMSHAFAISEESWRECYDLLAANRAVKGRKLSLDFDYVLALRESFDALARMHALFDKSERLVAAALVYRVEPHIDMTQWHGDLPEHGLGFSPMPALVAAYVIDAIDTGAHFVDLGISSVDGVPDPGLCRFKRSVGAAACQRLILRR